METRERIEDASENIFVEPPPSLNTQEPLFTRCCRLGANSILGLENVNEGSPVRSDFALWCLRDFAKLDDGDKNGLPAAAASSFSAGRTTNLRADGDFWIALNGFGDCVALKEISLTPYFCSDWLSKSAFVCESMMMLLTRIRNRCCCTRVSINYRQFVAANFT